MAKKTEDEDLRQLDAEDPKPPEAEKPPLTVSLDDDSDDAPEPADTPETRKGRRQQLRELRESNKRMESQLEELKGRLSAPQPIIIPQPAQAPQQRQDPHEAALKEIIDQEQATLRALSTPNLPASEDARLREHYYNLQQKRHDVHAERAAARMRQQEPQQRDDSDFKHLSRTYPKLFSSPALRMLAQARTLELAEKRNKPVDIELAQEACESLYVERGFRNRIPPPSDTERARHSSTGSRPAANGSGGNSFTPTKFQIAAAMSYTEHRKGLTDQQRIRAYYDEVLKPNGLTAS